MTSLWRAGRAAPVVVAPLFTLYDYSWRAPGTRTKADSLAYAYRTGGAGRDNPPWLPCPVWGSAAG
jgi:hypothetical protein